MSVKKTLQVPKVGDMVVYPYWKEKKGGYFVVLSEPKNDNDDMHVFRAWDSLEAKIKEKVWAYHDPDTNSTVKDENAWRYLDKTKNR
jgi:hypothetical protein